MDCNSLTNRRDDGNTHSVDINWGGMSGQRGVRQVQYAAVPQELKLKEFGLLLSLQTCVFFGSMRK